LVVVRNASEEAVLDRIDEAARKTAFVVVDLGGTASLMVAQAMRRSDLAAILTQGSEVDATEAAKAIKFLRRQERAYNRAIPFSLLFTRTSPAVRPRTLKAIELEFLETGIPIFAAALLSAMRSVPSFRLRQRFTRCKRTRLQICLPLSRTLRNFVAEVIGLIDKGKAAT
jgi:chromosome partitioning protein